MGNPGEGGRPVLKKTGKTEVIPADLVFLAMGFVSPVQEGPVKELGLSTDARQNIAVDKTHFTGAGNVFAAGDAVSGASLVVRAMASGQEAAKAIDRFLKKKHHK